MQTPISYLICATERTGSYLLCDALAGTGIAGRPQECFHPASLAWLSGQTQRPDYAAIFERLIEEGATPNGVFGAKLQWWQLQQLIRKLREVPGFGGIGVVELLQHWLPGARYIRLTRRDKLRQAISYHKATQTDVWWESDAWVRANRPAPAAQPTFDLAAIDGLIGQIGRHEATWQLFFETCGVQPLDIVYEDLVRDRAAIVRRVLDFLGVPIPGDLAITAPRYKQQADGVSEQWVRRYHELKPLPEADAPGAAPVVVAQEDREIIVSRRAAQDGAPPIRPRAERGRALRIVSYATQPLDGLPALLARCIAAHTPHTAHCVWGSAPPEAPLDPGAIDWTADPGAAAEALAAADVVLIHDGEVAPQHRALLADKAVVTLAHRPHAQHSPWLNLGFPGALLRPQLAELPAFQTWPRLPLPWGEAYDWNRHWMPLITQALPPPEPNGKVVYKGREARAAYAFEATGNGEAAHTPRAVQIDAPAVEAPAFTPGELFRPDRAAFDTGAEPAHHVIWLVGDGRSGTTWLANLLNYHQTYRSMFEPLHPSIWNFISHQNPYLSLRPHAGQSYLPVFQRIFAGQLRSSRVDRHSPTLRHEKGLLIKDIFGQLCLGWAARQFPHVKKVLLLRHPFAVALSKARLKQRGWNWLDEPKQLFAMPELYEDFLRPFTPILQDVATDFEKQVLVWAILHYVSLSQLRREDIYLVFYEELCVDFEHAIRRLLTDLGELQAGEPLDPRLLEQWRTPAHTSLEESAIVQDRNLIDVWGHQLTAEQIDKGTAILDAFGLGHIYSGSLLMPDRAAAERLLGAFSSGRDERRAIFPGLSRDKGEVSRMNIKLYPLYDQAVPIEPAPSERAWVASVAASGDLGLSTANGIGWELRCPYAFEVTWNGGPDPEDLTISIDSPDADAPAFVQSQLGDGLLTFHPGYQAQTEGPSRLWVRGPINWPKDGLAPLEQLLDTSLLPATITITWQCTRPHQPVRFAQGEPFGVILPHPQRYLDQCDVELVQPADAPEAYAHALQQHIQTPAMQELLERLQDGYEPAAPQRPLVDAPVEMGEHYAAQLGDAPPVSCICPTYARVALLEEAIHSFLQQDYPGQKELIVLNDYEGQTLAFAHPEVRIVNVPQRFSSVGEKYKAAVALCAHDLIFVWHDDDIYLPHRLSLSVAQFRQSKGFFKAGQAWFWNDGQLSGPEQNVFHGGSCFTRELFAEAHGYPHASSGFDIGFESLCEDLRAGATRGQALAPEELYYIYRWSGTGSYHLSAAGQNGQAHGAVAAHVQQQAAQGQIPLGRIALQPRWNADYTALVRGRLTNGYAKPVEAEEPFPPPFFVIPAPKPLEEAAAARLFRDTHPVRISVILPALNESVLLQRTVEQFAATLPANCEVIVVDNGSTDGSADFLVGRNCNGVSLIQSPRPLGVAGARNRGLEAARGEVIVFADAHIDVPERWWQPVVATLNRPNVGVVGPGIGVMGKPEHNAAYAQRVAEPNLRVEWLGWKQHEPYPVPSLGGGFMAMRRETLEQAGAFDPGMPQWGSEDLELCVRYWLLGYEVWVVPEVTILHYFRKVNPLQLKAGIVTHNVLRVALLHFSQERIDRVVSALRERADLGPALAHAVDSDVWQRRAELAARRVRDDDWFFEQFRETCVV